MLRAQTTRAQLPQKEDSNLCSFIIGVTQGSLFILFSLNFHGSDECIILKRNSLIFGIILLMGCFFILVQQIFSGSTDVCAVSCLRFMQIICYIIELIFYFIVLVDLFDNEDCGGLRTFALVFYISSLIMFLVILLIFVCFITQNQVQGER